MASVISSAYTGQVQTTTAASQTKTTGVDTGLGQDAFLRMFMAQMTNQNPLDPMDNTEFTAQLATFSQLEQLTKIAKSVEGIGKLENAIYSSQVSSYLGKEVSMSGDLIPVTAGKAGGASFILGAAAQVKVVISDQTGARVAEKDLGSKAAGQAQFQWDGTDDSGNQVPDGV